MRWRGHGNVFQLVECTAVFLLRYILLCRRSSGFPCRFSFKFVTRRPIPITLRVLCWDNFLVSLYSQQGKKEKTWAKNKRKEHRQFGEKEIMKEVRKHFQYIPMNFLIYVTWIMHFPCSCCISYACPMHMRCITHPIPMHFLLRFPIQFIWISTQGLHLLKHFHQRMFPAFPIHFILPFLSISYGCAMHSIHP